MNKKLVTLVSSSVLMALPLVTGAVFVTPPLPGLVTFSGLVDAIVNILWPLLAATSVIVFLVAAFLFLTSQGDPTKTAAARQALIWGVVGLVVALISLSIPTIIKTLSGL